MYMVLKKDESCYTVTRYSTFSPYFSDSIDAVRKAMEDDASLKVYKLDGLLEIKSIDATYKENFVSKE